MLGSLQLVSGCPVDYQLDLTAAEMCRLTWQVSAHHVAFCSAQTYVVEGVTMSISHTPIFKAYSDFSSCLPKGWRGHGEPLSGWAGTSMLVAAMSAEMDHV